MGIYKESLKYFFNYLQIQLNLVNDGLRNVALCRVALINSNKYIYRVINPLLEKYPNLEYIKKEIYKPNYFTEKNKKECSKDTIAKDLYTYDISIFSSLEILKKWENEVIGRKDHIKTGEMLEYPFPVDLPLKIHSSFKLYVYINDIKIYVVEFIMPIDFNIEILKNYYEPFVEYYKKQNIVPYVTIDNELIKFN